MSAEPKRDESDPRKPSRRLTLEEQRKIAAESNAKIRVRREREKAEAAAGLAAKETEAHADTLRAADVGCGSEMLQPTNKPHGGGGGSRGRSREKPAKPTFQNCACNFRNAEDVNVCQGCGAALLKVRGKPGPKPHTDRDKVKESVLSFRIATCIAKKLTDQGRKEYLGKVAKDLIEYAKTLNDETVKSGGLT